MEVQIHSNCIPSSFYTSKRARITGDSQSRVRLLYFTRSRHLPVSICLTVSSKCCVSDSLLQRPPNLPPLLIYIIQVSHYKASMFQRNLQRIWGCIMSHMFAELAEIKRHAWKSMTMTVEHNAWPIESISNCDTKQKQHNYYFILLEYDTEMLFCRYYTLKSNFTEQWTQGWIHIQIRPLDFCNVKGKTLSLYSLFSLKVSVK